MTTPLGTGRQSPGTTTRPARWQSLRKPHSGITPANRPCPCAGLGARPQWRVQPPSPALHRSGRRSGADPGMVRAALATGGHFHGNQGSSRAHLGVETQRQWSDRAIARTTPILMGLFSWITRAAHQLQKQRPLSPRTAAWYAKPAPTFVDAIALIRRHRWLSSESFSTSTIDFDGGKAPPHSMPGLLTHWLTPLECAKSSLERGQSGGRKAVNWCMHP